MNGYTNSPLVLLHGFPLDARMWDSVIEPLTEFHRVHALHLPGFGQRASTAEISLAAWAQDVQQQLEELKIKQPIQLCGLSMGGYVAMEFAAQFPEKLSRLILCDTKTEADAPEARKNRLAMADALKSPNSAIAQQALETLIAEMPHKLLAPINLRQDSEVFHKVIESIKRIPPHAFADAQLAMAARRDTTEDIVNLACPVLGIVGREDRLTPPALMQALISQCVKGSIQVIDNSGHLPPMETPAEFVRAVVNA